MKIYGKENKGVCYVGLGGLVWIYDYKSNQFLRPDTVKKIPLDVLEALCEDSIIIHKGDHGEKDPRFYHNSSAPVPVVDKSEFFYDQVLEVRRHIRSCWGLREIEEGHERDIKIIVSLLENLRFADAEVLCRLSGINLEQVYRDTKYTK